MVQIILVDSGYRAGSKLSGTWPWSDLGQGEYWLGIYERIFLMEMVGDMDPGFSVVHQCFWVYLLSLGIRQVILGWPALPWVLK